MKFILFSPLAQFEVTNLINFNSPLFAELNLTLTNFSLYIILMTIIIIGLHYLSNNENSLVPSN
jgi:F0F1-type ATP synthase membrane subunit a